MSLLSLLAKGGTKALGYGKRIAKVTPDFLLGETSQVIGGAMRSTKGSLFTKGRAGFRALESHVATQTAANGNFFARAWKSLKGTKGAVTTGYKTAAATAKAAGKSGVWAGIKGGGKALMTKMPLIGSALLVLMEAPNIFKAFKDGGFKAGVKEIGGAAVELGGFAAGAAIGSCFGPVGTAVGSLIGGIVGAFARGKSHSEKKAEEEALAQQQQTEYYNTLKGYGLSDDEINQLYSSGYSLKEVEKVLAAEAEAQTKETVASYDPSQAYSYNNFNAVPNMGFNNPYQMYPNFNTENIYENDVYYQQLFGANPTTNPFKNFYI